MTTICALVIGDELLDGRVKDGNSNSLGQSLAELGLELKEARVVPDDRRAIVHALRELAIVADVIVTSGGLGPTSDDITAECVAEAAGVGMRFDDAAMARITAMFEARGIPMPESNRRQATLPATSRTLENQRGTAPGFVTPLPIVGRGDGRVAEVWSFPGVPREYEGLLDDELVPALTTRLVERGAPRLARRTLRCTGLAESAIGERLAAFERAHADVRVQYRAAFPEILVSLVVSHEPSADPAGLAARLDALVDEAQAAIGKSVWGTGTTPIEERVLAACRAAGVTLATAESCTGGLIAKRLTDVAGSSDVVVGGVVSYANSAKVALLGVDAGLIETRGAVSPEVAQAMAEGARVRLSSSLAVSVTGVAGPGGGSADKPVGTVHFGLSDARGTVTVHKKFPDFGRDRIREMAAATALRLVLWRLSPEGRDATGPQKA